VITEYVTHSQNESSKSEPLDPDHKPGIHDMSDRGDIPLLIYSSSALCGSEHRKLRGNLDPTSNDDIPGVPHADAYLPEQLYVPSFLIHTKIV
jgi:hypothetical protein